MECYVAVVSYTATTVWLLLLAGKPDSSSRCWWQVSFTIGCCKAWPDEWSNSTKASNTVWVSYSKGRKYCWESIRCLLSTTEQLNIQIV